MNQMPNYTPEAPKCGSTGVPSANPIVQKIRQWITTFIALLLEELDARMKPATDGFWIMHGVMTWNGGREVEYVFDTAREFGISESCNAVLKADGRKVLVRIVECEAGSVTVLAKEPLQGDLRRAQIFPLHGRNLEKEMDQLRALDDPNTEPNLHLALVAVGELEPRPGDATFRMPEVPGGVLLNSDQCTAVARIMTNEFTTVVGPRSSGKTTTAAAATAMLNRTRETVLFIARTNEDADEAAIAILNAMGGSSDLAAGRVVRFGHISDRKLFQHPLITPNGILNRTHPSVFEEIKRLQGYERMLPSASRRSLIIEQGEKQRQLNNEWMKEPLAKLDELTSQVLLEAKVIITTVADLLACKELHSWKPDAVLVDQANRMRPTEIMLLAARGKRLALFDDIYTLPPWVRSKAKCLMKPLLNQGVFSLNGIKEKYSQGQPDSRMVLLRTQFQVAPVITKVINTIHGGVLINGTEGRNTRVAAAVERATAEGRVLLYDMGTFRSQTRRIALWSKFQLSLDIYAYGLACRLMKASKQQVGLLSVYHGQAQIHHALNSRSHTGPKVSTIQSLNAKRFESVVLDLSVSGSPGHWGTPLIGDRASVTANYVNAAFSAAHNQIVILADEKCVGNLEGNSVLHGVFDVLRNEGIAFVPFPFASLAVDNPAAKCGLTFHASEDEVRSLLHQDLANARTMVAATWRGDHVENTLTEEFLCRWSPRSVPKVLAANIASTEVRDRLARHRVHLTSPYVMGEPEHDPNVGEDSLLVIDSKVAWIPGWDVWGNTVRPWIRIQGNRAPRLISRLAFLDEDLEQAAQGYELPTPTTEVAR